MSCSWAAATQRPPPDEGDEPHQVERIGDRDAGERGSIRRCYGLRHTQLRRRGGDVTEGGVLEIEVGRRRIRVATLRTNCPPSPAVARKLRSRSEGSSATCVDPVELSEEARRGGLVDRWPGDVASRGHGRQLGTAGGRRRQATGKPEARLMTRRWISDVPSPISRILASR